MPHSYRPWGLPFKGLPPEFSLPRPILHRLVAERSGHRDFAEYHRRFGFPKEVIKPYRCGAERVPGHFARYTRIPALYRTSPEELVGDDHHLVFLDFLEKHRPYGP